MICCILKLLKFLIGIHFSFESMGIINNSLRHLKMCYIKHFMNYGVLTPN